MPRPLYAHPERFEQAFAWRDYPAEVAVIRELWRRHGRGPLKRVLELACGSAPHAPELVAAGCTYLGLDRAGTMLSAARRRCPTARLLRADLLHPPLATGAVDLAMVLLGSLYLPDESALVPHLDRLAELVRPGGCYLLDWCLLYDPPEAHTDRWRTADGVEVHYRTEARAEGRISERLELRSAGHDYLATSTSWAITAEAFAAAVTAHRGWDLVGAWNDWDLTRPLPTAAPVVRPLVLLTRR